ncbi:TraR/DksA C4-type zinc finger protein [Corallococcus sp. bb12-1]|uniref:TraR/DksA family transcriptional regulator n=1 Tax=Corallococcus terminator TaxID=2316733 RepID=A0A3A8INV0_9BACT|nr:MULTISPECIES: TraR/DksA C4-type zinc finger protein [Corallococcus]MCY1042736.1 TraR/DksA C4-type zinc finger protein [Corallococcus sp. bb12-1]RKG85127.1 TraR/DksA family transcriptional regulator [Corallococcus terminator]
MSRAKDLLGIRELLQKRRKTTEEAQAGARRELMALKDQERDPEYEEQAQAELADYTLSTLIEAQRREIMLIDAALRRMDTDVFGECVDCGNEISMDRLEAMPFAIRCEEDAALHEQETRDAARHTGSLSL